MSATDAASAAEGGFDIVPLSEEHLPGVLRALGDAFGPGFDQNWFQWKHRQGPWGVSPGWVGVDDQGVIGVRLFLPWRFRYGEAEYLALRPCDTVTTPRARGRGVFRALTDHALGRLEGQCDLFFNTPNQSSRPGYFRLGFKEWAVVRQHVGVVSSRPARLTEMTERGDDSEPGMSTDRGLGYLEWRYRSCPRHNYRLVSLEAASGPNGIVYRPRRGRWGRVLVVSELWGAKVERKALIAAATATEGTRLVWVAARDRDVLTIARKRGGTLVTHRPARETSLPVPTFSVGDIEDVI